MYLYHFQRSTNISHITNNFCSSGVKTLFLKIRGDVPLQKKMSSAATLKQYPTIGTILDPPKFLLVNTFKPNIGHS
jgi:hypothetical protein